MTKCIGQINHYNQVDWSKNTCFMPLVKKDVSINKKRLVNQFELFEKPSFIVMMFHLQLPLVFCHMTMSICHPH
jgi:hypothetical protein